MRATMDLVGPSRQALNVQSSFDDSHMLTTPRERTEAVDDGKAPDWNDLEMGKMWQWSRRRRGVGNLTGSGAGWAYTRQRITEGAERRDDLAICGVAFR